MLAFQVTAGNDDANANDGAANLLPGSPLAPPPSISPLAITSRPRLVSSGEEQGKPKNLKTTLRVPGFAFFL